MLLPVPTTLAELEKLIKHFPIETQEDAVNAMQEHFSSSTKSLSLLVRETQPNTLDELTDLVRGEFDTAVKECLSTYVKANDEHPLIKLISRMAQNENAVPLFIQYLSLPTEIFGEERDYTKYIIVETLAKHVRRYKKGGEHKKAEKTPILIEHIIKLYQDSPNNLAARYYAVHALSTYYDEHKEAIPEEVHHIYLDALTSCDKEIRDTIFTIFLSADIRRHPKNIAFWVKFFFLEYQWGVDYQEDGLYCLDDMCDILEDRDWSLHQITEEELDEVASIFSTANEEGIIGIAMLACAIDSKSAIFSHLIQQLLFKVTDEALILRLIYSLNREDSNLLFLNNFVKTHELSEKVLKAIDDKLDPVRQDLRYKLDATLDSSEAITYALQLANHKKSKGLLFSYICEPYYARIDEAKISLGDYIRTIWQEVVNHFIAIKHPIVEEWIAKLPKVYWENEPLLRRDPRTDPRIHRLFKDYERALSSRIALHPLFILSIYSVSQLGQISDEICQVLLDALTNHRAEIRRVVSKWAMLPHREDSISAWVKYLFLEYQEQQEIGSLNQIDYFKSVTAEEIQSLRGWLENANEEEFIGIAIAVSNLRAEEAKPLIQPLLLKLKDETIKSLLFPTLPRHCH